MAIGRLCSGYEVAMGGYEVAIGRLCGEYIEGVGGGYEEGRWRL